MFALLLIFFVFAALVFGAVFLLSKIAIQKARAGDIWRDGSFQRAVEESVHIEISDNECLIETRSKFKNFVILCGFFGISAFYFHKIINSSKVEYTNFAHENKLVLIYNIISAHDLSIDVFILVLFSVVFFFSFLSFFRYSISGNPLFCLDRNGIRHYSWSNSVIPWQELLSLDLRHIKSVGMVIVQIDPKKYPSKNWISRITRSKYIPFSTADAGQGFGRLLAMFRHYRPDLYRNMQVGSKPGRNDSRGI